MHYKYEIKIMTYFQSQSVFGTFMLGPLSTMKYIQPLLNPRLVGVEYLSDIKVCLKNCLVGTRLQDVGEHTSGHFAFDHSVVEKPIWILRLSDRNHSLFQRSKNSCEDYRMGLQPNWGNLWRNNHEQSRYRSSSKGRSD